MVVVCKQGYIVMVLGQQTDEYQLQQQVNVDQRMGIHIQVNLQLRNYVVLVQLLHSKICEELGLGLVILRVEVIIVFLKIVHDEVQVLHEIHLINLQYKIINYQAQTKSKLCLK